MTAPGGRRPITVHGGSNGIEAHYDDMVCSARLFARAGLDCADHSLALHGYLAEPDVLASVPLDPGGAASFETALLAALDGPHGLTWIAAECGGIDVQLRAAAASYLAVDRLKERYGPEVVGAVKLLRAEAAGAGAALHGKSWKAAMSKAASADPELLDAMIGFWSQFHLTRLLAAYPDGRPRLTATGTTAGTAPRSLQDIMAGLAQRDLGKGGDIDVKIITDADGHRHVLVDIPGTKSWSPDPRSGDVTSVGTDLRAISGTSTTYEKAVIEALRRAGVRPDDPVMLVGHSEGGMIAVNTAEQLSHTHEFQVTHVVTAGSPIGHLHVPAGVSVLALENDGDVVPHCDGTDNPDHTNVTTVVLHRNSGDIGTNHRLATSYVPGAGDVDASDDPSVRSYLESIRGFLQSGQVETHTFHAERLP
ncbi:MAG: alpha/beta hydrolase [Jatrophihabitans sp.]